MTTPVLPAVFRDRPLRHRPLRPDDAGMWAELLAAAEEVDDAGEHYSAADLAAELTDPELDLDHDSVLVLDGERPAAVQVLRLRVGGRGRALHPDASVHPAYRRRGIGSALVALARQRAADLDAVLYLRVPAAVPGAVALAERSGLLAVRWWSTLRRDLSGPVTPVALPEGLDLVPLGPGYDAARWDEALWATRNTCFRDHWGSADQTFESFVNGRTGSRAFRSEVSAVVLTADATAVAFLLAYEYDAATARTGRRDLRVATVGTLAAWRGRGVAGALLAHTLRGAQERGYVSSTLTVDTGNATGALGVYTRAGYVPHRRETTYTPGLQGWP